MHISQLPFPPTGGTSSCKGHYGWLHRQSHRYTQQGCYCPWGNWWKTKRPTSPMTANPHTGRSTNQRGRGTVCGNQPLILWEHQQNNLRGGQNIYLGINGWRQHWDRSTQSLLINLFMHKQRLTIHNESVWMLVHANRVAIHQRPTPLKWGWNYFMRDKVR